MNQLNQSISFVCKSFRIMSMHMLSYLILKFYLFCKFFYLCHFEISCEKKTLLLSENFVALLTQLSFTYWHRPKTSPEAHFNHYKKKWCLYAYNFLSPHQLQPTHYRQCRNFAQYFEQSQTNHSHFMLNGFIFI